jgi:DNA mismatch repair protein MutS
VVRPGYDPHIDEIVAANREAQSWINNLEARERERTGIKSLRVDYNKVFGYYIEVSRAHSEQVPAAYERKQTLVAAERFITAELKEYESIVLNAQQRLVELERDAFARICGDLAEYGARLRTAAHTLARIDVYAALAEAAVRGRYVRPTLDESTTLHIEGGRHPVVERTLDVPFVANDMHLDTDEQQLLLITGPNMAGKSTMLRQAALIVLLAQIGAFVPADAAHIGLVDRIFTRIGAQDDIATGQSTFMVEMTETAALLLQSSQRSLIILDEVGRGTSTYDGMAIARAVVEYIHNDPRLRCRTLFATHYHELTALEDLLPRVRNYHMAAVEQEGQVIFLYELRPGGADRSYGIHVAELAGIPRPVIRRAAELLAALEGREQPVTPDSPPPAATPDSPPAPPSAAPAQLSLFDVAPNPVVEYLKRLNINELTPLEALTRLYELQKLAQTPADEQ